MLHHELILRYSKDPERTYSIFFGMLSLAAERTLDFSFLHFPLDDHSQTFLFDCILQQRNEKRIILSQVVSMYLEMFENTDKSKPHIKHIAEELYTLKKDLPDGVKKVKDIMDLAKLQMNDLRIQRKAANELFSVLQKLVDPPSSKRKRSQSQRRCNC
uniref:Interferon gamma n=1 Tax=Pavo cristatus TaxID=9049 RepID=A0A8C9FTG0_PAVCR